MNSVVGSNAMGLELASCAFLGPLCPALLFSFLVVATIFLCAGKNQGKTQPSSTNVTEEPPKRNGDEIKPKRIALNEKEMLIKQGLQAGKNAYPTLDDAQSDWSDKDDKDGKKKDHSKKGKKGERSAKDDKKKDANPDKEGKEDKNNQKEKEGASKQKDPKTASVQKEPQKEEANNKSKDAVGNEVEHSKS